MVKRERGLWKCFFIISLQLRRSRSVFFAAKEAKACFVFGLFKEFTIYTTRPALLRVRGLNFRSGMPANNLVKVINV